MIFEAISFEIRLKLIARRDFERDRNAAETERDRGIAGKARIGVKNFVAGFEEGHHGEEQDCFAAGSDYYVAGRNVDAARALQICGYFFAQSGDTGDRAVAVFAFCEGLCRRFDDRRPRMEVGLAEF